MSGGIGGVGGVLGGTGIAFLRSGASEGLANTWLLEEKVWDALALASVSVCTVLKSRFCSEQDFVNQKSPKGHLGCLLIFWSQEPQLLVCKLLGTFLQSLLFIFSTCYLP
jgi:hypothetical protein